MNVFAGTDESLGREGVSMEYEARYRRIGMIARNTLAFHVELISAANFTFVPGQYVYLEWKDPPTTIAKGDGRNFSIASPPEELPSLTFATRLTGSVFKNGLLSFPKDSPITVSGPFGEFCLPVCLGEGRTNSWDAPIILIAAGIGITPYRSMLLHALNDRPDMSFFLFTANHRLDESPFRRELEELAKKNKNLFLCQHVSQPDESIPQEFNSGPLTPTLIFEIVGSKAQRGHYFMSGPPSMVTSFKNSLLSAGISVERIHSDPFFGYS